MFNLLMLGSGLFWTITYLLIIRQGRRDRTYGMPMPALCANLSWEFIFAVLHPHGLPQVVVNWIWLLFDLVIAGQVVRYGPREWKLPWSLFCCLFLCTLTTAFAGVLLVTYEFVEFDKWSGAYAAFGQNLMMSVLFVELYRQRGGRSGQSLSIAACKMAGTLLASLAFALLTDLGNSPLMLYLFISIFVFDLLYVVLLARQQQQRHGSKHAASEVTESLERATCH